MRRRSDPARRSRVSRPVLAAVSLVVAWAGWGAHVPARSAQDWRAAALASFDDAWQTIDRTFYDPQFGGLDWNAVRTELRPRVAAARDAEAAREVIREMLARLHESHFTLLSSASAAETLPGEATVAIDLRAAAGTLVVVRVTPGSSAARAGVHPGDRLAALDDQAVADWWKRAEGADDRARALWVWQRAYRALHGAAASLAKLVLIDPAGAERHIGVAREAEAGEVVTVGNLPPLHAWTRVSESRTASGKRVGVIAFNIWMTAIADPFARAIDAYRHADGLVIDLRGNPGGLAEMIRGIAGHVLAAPELLGRVHMRGVDLEFRANPRRSTPDGRAVEPFAGPVAILVDELTASTSECFAGGLQSLHRARVFGQPTMGQALPAATEALPNGDVLLYAIGDFTTSTGQRLEGAGITPDEVVPRTLAALARGEDAPLEAALAWIDGPR